MTIDRKEVLRYMGAGRGEVQAEIAELVERLCIELESTVKPRYVYRPVKISTDGKRVVLDGVEFESEKLSTFLSGATEGIVLSATLGTEADNIIRRQGVLGTVNAAAAQAAATAMIEDFLNGLCPLPRFSPGYGDWSLEAQPLLLALCDAKKRIGVTLTDSLMMIPTKSVTAVIGFRDDKTCKDCSIKDCEFRK